MYMENLRKNKEPKSSNNIRINKSFLLAAIFSVLSYQTWSFANNNSNNINLKETKIPKNAEYNEEIWSYEKIFKEWIKNAAKGLKSLSQIPNWGQIIDYYRESGALAWRKMTPEVVQSLQLPPTFDILPKKIEKPVSSMILCLWTRKFEITPWVGRIKNIIFTENELIIETTILVDIKYDKQEKLPELALKLRRSDPKEKEKSGFKWSTVREL